MTRIIVLETTFSSKEEAKRVATGIIEKGLAACCQIIPSVISTYVWQEKIEIAEECILRCKTLEEKVLPLQEYILSVHPYQVSELISYPAECGNKLYYAWMQSCVEGSSA